MMLTWLRKNMKAIMVAVAVLFIGSMFYGLGYRGLKGDFGGGKSSSGVLAKVNGREVDPYRYREVLNRVVQNFGQEVSPQNLPFIQSLALGQAIDFSLMLNEAKKKVRVPGREVDAAIESIMKQQNIPSKRELEIALKRAGIPYRKFRDFIKDEITVQKFSLKLQEGVKVTPDDLREVKASHVLLSTESEAKDIAGRIRKGEDFSALAKKYSRDPGSAGKGGDLGYFAAGRMIEPFEKAAFSLKVGEVSGVVKTPYGYHVIKVVDSRMRKFPGGEKDAEKQVLKEKQETAFRKWYSDVRGKAKVEIISPELRGHDFRMKGQLQAAAEEYKRAIQENPANPYLRIFLGDAYLALGQKPQAFSEYEYAVKIEGGNPELYIILGKAYESAGQKDLASVQYRKASLVAGDNKALHERLLKLFEAMQRGGEAAQEKQEIKRIEKKEKFEKELSGKK